MPSITQIDALAPTTRIVNETAQTTLTVASWLVAGLVIVWAVRSARRTGTWLPVTVVLAVAIGVINEPLFDKAYHLYFYDGGKQWTWLSTFGYPQPNWTMSAYIILYAAPALYLMSRAKRGVSRQWLYRYFAAMAIFVGAFESIAIVAGGYEYYGNHPFMLGKYPLWLGVMEGAHVVVFSTLIMVLSPVIAKGWKTLLTLPLFLISFCSVMFGAGFPGLAVINANPVPTAVTYLGSIASVGLAAVMVWLVSLALPSDGKRTDTVPTFLRGLADRLSPPESSGHPEMAPQPADAKKFTTAGV
ncbi:MAG TPA: hypothetical protein VG294_09175 [Solirubrobacteraceae bacterium]|jgi:hypothetical protein|nr:hypothetical protein [Solirubrobacteraceae bacterium]